MKQYVICAVYKYTFIHSFIQHSAMNPFCTWSCHSIIGKHTYQAEPWTLGTADKLFLGTTKSTTPQFHTSKSPHRSLIHTLLGPYVSRSTHPKVHILSASTLLWVYMPPSPHVPKSPSSLISHCPLIHIVPPSQGDAPIPLLVTAQRTGWCWYATTLQ